MLTKTKLSGNSCPPPGSVPHGNWTCKEQETPIIGTSFLDEDPQTYLGKTDKEFTQSIHLLKVVTTISAFPNSGSEGEGGREGGGYPLTENFRD